jgi:DNA-directed RNA polymerase subunit RPC12/RpoP
MTESTETTPHQFPCTKCGAKLEFQPGTDSLICPYCGTTNMIAAPTSGVPLLDFTLYSREFASAPEVHDTVVVHCTNCGAETHLAQDVTAGRCAFCGAPVVAQGQSKKLIKPGGLLPFIVNKAQANTLFREWISGLWFAPSDLAKRSEQAGIDGAYIPSWTFNSAVQTSYTGQRGDDYQVTETFTEMVNGHPETRTRTVTRTRWSPAGGTVANKFRDVLVLATQSLPPKQADHLQPWDLGHLVPYADDYISGMACQSYQIDLGHGFEAAKQLMAPEIQLTIRRDIGGDHQQITSAESQYFDILFRHILLPLWISAYHFNGRTFRFLVNARTGAVQGERPFSVIKITLLILAIVAASLLLLAVFHHVH